MAEKHHVARCASPCGGIAISAIHQPAPGGSGMTRRPRWPVAAVCAGALLLAAGGQADGGDALVVSPRPPDYALTAEGARISICYNWSCAKIAPLDVAAAELETVLVHMGRCAGNDIHGRLQRLRVGVWQMEVLAERHLPVLANDLAINDGDAELEGRTDCVDNASNTATFLSLLLDLGALPGWSMGLPQVRDRFSKDVHWTATVVDESSGERWAVDSWLRPNGNLPFVSPVRDWIAGRAPWRPPLAAWNPYPRTFAELCPSAAADGVPVAPRGLRR